MPSVTRQVRFTAEQDTRIAERAKKYGVPVARLIRFATLQVIDGSREEIRKLASAADALDAALDESPSEPVRLSPEPVAVAAAMLVEPELVQPVVAVDVEPPVFVYIEKPRRPDPEPDPNPTMFLLRVHEDASAVTARKGSPRRSAPASVARRAPDP